MSAQALRLGFSKELARQLRSVLTILQHDPQAFGEIYRKRSPIEEFLGAQGFLGVDYAVDVERQLVLVRKCVPLSGFPDS
jgi:hypothetical protein